MSNAELIELTSSNGKLVKQHNYKLQTTTRKLHRTRILLLQQRYKD